MKYFKPSILSIVVCSSMATTANAAPSDSNYFSVKSDAKKSQSQLINQSMSKAALAAQVTSNGMKSTFDDSLNRATFVWASQSQQMPSLSNVAPEQRDAVAAEFYLSNLTGVKTSSSINNRANLQSLHNQGSGAIVAKYKQEVYGVEVFNREFNVVMNQEHRLVAASGYLSERSAVNSTLAITNFGSAEESIKSAFTAMGGNAENTNISVAGVEENKYQKFASSFVGDGYQILNQPRAKKVMYELNGKLVAAHYIEIEAGKSDEMNSDYFSYVIAANTGRVLYKKNLTNSETAFNYRVYADKELNNLPQDGPMGDVTPWPFALRDDSQLPTDINDAEMVSLISGPISTNDPWLADDAEITSGNNVSAYVDAIAPQGFSAGDYYAKTTSANTFDYPLKPDQSHYSQDNRNAAITNLFYVNNYLHDQFYDHGFDELSGNAQLSNFGRGGEEGDVLNAEAQDNSGFNNANMSTPADGASPRMQMYLYDDFLAKVGDDYGVSIKGTADDVLLSSTQVSGFGVRRFSGGITGEVVRFVDADNADGGSFTDGCQEPTNAAELAGKIAIIDRGACAFTEKVKFAQDAGSIGVVIANILASDPTGNEPAPMGGTDDTVTIPNMGLSTNDGQKIYDAIALGTTTISMFNDSPYRDGTFDNGTVAHEWGHYISNRLVGNASGLSNNQGRSMGEGWGDFHALLLMVRAEDVNIEGNDKFQAAYSGSGYTDNFYTGIRRAPYSTDMTINPLTFKHIERGVDLPEPLISNDNAEVHAAGEIWTVALWEVYVGLINDERHTFEEAQSLMMDYLVAGYKVTPLAPTYTEARDALLSVAFANDPADGAVMLKAFAKRGLGLGAISPDRNDDSHSGVVESFTNDLASYTFVDAKVDANYTSATMGYCSNDNILDNNETAAITVSIMNSGGTTLNNVKAKLVLESGQEVTFANEGEITFDAITPYATAVSTPIEVTLKGASVADELQFSVTFPELEADDDIVEALSQTITTVVNYSVEDAEVVSNSAFDDFESPAGRISWSENVMIGGEAAEGTSSLDSFFTPQLAGLLPGLGENMLYLNNNSFMSDVSVETQEFDVGFNGDFVVSWTHYYQIEANFDGGVVEVSVNDGDWTDATEMGGVFPDTSGYIGVLTPDNPSQPLSEDRLTFNGTGSGEESLNFGTALNGNKVRFRFRLATDFTANDIGWLIDNVRFNNVETPIFKNIVSGDVLVCDNHKPFVTSVVGESISERASDGGAFNTGTLSVVVTDLDGNELTYSWTQKSGPEAIIANAGQATASYTAPLITEDTTLVFEVTISDGTDSVVEEVSVQLTNVSDVAPVVEESSSSSGGALGLLSFLLVPFAMLRRRKRV